MMKLYYGQGTCSLVAHIALRLAGEAFDLHKVDLAKGEQNSPAYRAVNPHGKVPVLDLGDGRTLTESTVIATYIAELFPSAELLPTDRMQLFRGRELMTWANAKMHSTTFAAIFRPVRFSDDEAVQAKIREAGKERLKDDFAFLDSRIAARDWGADDQTTITDLFLYVYGRWAARVGLSLDEYPAYRDLLARIDALPATQASLEAEGLK